MNPPDDGPNVIDYLSRITRDGSRAARDVNKVTFDLLLIAPT